MATRIYAPTNRGGTLRASGLCVSLCKTGRDSLPDKKAGSESYGAKDITVLEGLEAVRRRPGMYIGSTGPKGLHHLVYEVLDNAVDEALQDFCDHVVITLLPDGRVSVHDNGRGIPVAAMADSGV